MIFRQKLRVLRKTFRGFDRRAALIFFLLRNLHKPPDVIFRGAWRIIDGATSKRLVKERFGVPLRHVRHYRLRQAIKQIFPKYSPAVIVDREIMQFVQGGPSVIASIHARTEFAMCAALDRAGLQCVIITANPVKPAEIQNYDLSAPPQNILRERDVFVQARAALRGGKVVICDVDFIVDKDLPSARVCISTSLFEFARKAKAKLLFGYTQVSADGEMNCILEAAPPNSASAEEDARRFIAFLERVQGGPSDLTIGNWARPLEIKPPEITSGAGTR